MGQERVLLGLVEPMDLVEEEDRPLLVERETVLGLGDRRPDVGDAAHHRRQRHEMGADLLGEEAGEARLAGARRTPQQGRGEVAPGDAPAERAALADEVLLADELLEAARPHPGRERLLLGRRLEERLRAGAAGSGRRARGGHGAMVAGDGPGGAVISRSGPRGRRRGQKTWATFSRMSMTTSTISSPPPTIAIRRRSRWT